MGEFPSNLLVCLKNDCEIKKYKIGNWEFISGLTVSFYLKLVKNLGILRKVEILSSIILRYL